MNYSFTKLVTQLFLLFSLYLEQTEDYTQLQIYNLVSQTQQLQDRIYEFSEQTNFTDAQLRQLNVYVQVHEYSTNKFDVFQTRQLKFQKQEERNIHFVLLKQQENSNIEKLTGAKQNEKNQQTKIYATFNKNQNSIYILIVLYDGLNRQDIFMDFNYQIYHFDFYNNLGQFKKLQNDTYEAYHLEQFKKQKNIKEQQQQNQNVQIEFQLNDESKFIKLSVFNLVNESLQLINPLSEQYKEQEQDYDVDMNYIKFDIDDQNYTINHIDQLFFIIPIEVKYQYKLKFYLKENENYIIINESYKGMKTYHNLVSLTKTQKNLKLQITSLENQQIIGEYYGILLIDQDPQKLLVQIKLDEEQNTLELRQNHINKTQNFIIQTNSQIPSGHIIKNFQFEKVKISKVDKSLIPEAYVSSYDITKNIQTEQIQQDRYKLANLVFQREKRMQRIIFWTNAKTCAIPSVKINNKLFQLLLVEEVIDNQTSKMIIKDYIQVDQRFVKFFEFNFFTLYEPNKECRIQLIEDLIIVIFSDRQYQVLDITMHDDYYEFKINNDLKCQNQTEDNLDESLVKKILDLDFKFVIKDKKLEDKFLIQNIIEMSTQRIQIPLYVIDSSFRNQFVFGQQDVQDIEIPIVNYLDQQNLQQYMLSCLPNKKNTYIALALIKKENKIMKIQISKKKQQIKVKYNNNSVIIKLNESYYRFIKQSHFKKLAFEIYDQNLHNIILSLDVMTRIHKNLLILQFYTQQEQLLNQIFENPEIYFLEKFQDIYKNEQQNHIKQYSSFGSESEQESEFEEIDNDILRLRLSINSEINQKKILFYQIQMNSFQTVFTKCVLDQDQPDQNNYQIKDFNFFDYIVDTSMTRYKNLYCSNTKFDVDVLCPINLKTNQYILKAEDSQGQENLDFYQNSRSFVFTLLSPMGQVMVMDYTYARQDIVYNCIGLIFTKSKLIVSNTTQKINYKSLYAGSPSSYDSVFQDIVTNITHLNIENQNQTQLDVQGLNFIEELIQGLRVQLKVSAYNFHDNGKVGVGQALLKTMTKMFNHSFINFDVIKEQQNYTNQNIINKVINISQKQADEFSQLTDTFNQNRQNIQEQLSGQFFKSSSLQDQLDIIEKSEPIIKIVPIIFNLVQIDEHKNVTPALLNTNYLRYEPKDSQNFINLDGNIKTLKLNLRFSVQSLDPIYIEDIEIKRQQFLQQIQQKEEVRQRVMSVLRQNNSDPNIINSVQNAHQQAREQEQSMLNEMTF